MAWRRTAIPETGIFPVHAPETQTNALRRTAILRLIRKNCPRGYILDYPPSAKTRALIDAAQGVLDDYRAHSPLTVQQLFSRLVATGTLGNSEGDYNELCHHLAHAGVQRRILSTRSATTQFSCYQWIISRKRRNFAQKFETGANPSQLTNWLGKIAVWRSGVKYPVWRRNCSRSRDDIRFASNQVAVSIPTEFSNRVCLENLFAWRDGGE